MKKILTLLIILTGVIPSGIFAQKQFSFKEGKFKIAQFTDMHWAPNSDKISTTKATIQAVLKKENPDFAILTGDIITGEPTLEGWSSVISIFEEAKMPFTVLMGNHDPEFLNKNCLLQRYQEESVLHF